MDSAIFVVTMVKDFNLSNFYHKSIWIYNKRVNFATTVVWEKFAVNLQPARIKFNT